jgi:hypothetical protein
MPDAVALSTVRFISSPAGRRTFLSILVQHESRENRDIHLQSGMEQGLNEALDLLEEVSAGE